MQKIGQGWQYAVYDLGNGRVLKKKYSMFSQFFHIRSNQIGKGKPYSFIEIIRAIVRVNGLARDAVRYFKVVSEKECFDLLANPVFLNGINYEQDKIVPLKIVFAQCSIPEGKNIFDKYISLIHKTWQCGFSDTIFNFVGNNGLDKEGNVIQSDFGELVFTKKEILKIIESKKWLLTSCLRRFPDGEMKEYYKMRMEQEMTEENLNKFFKTR